jgi:predicted dehydrogenase
MEKTPAATSAEVEAMLAAQRASGRTAQVGYKHYFFPALVKAKEWIDSPEFGVISTMYASYPLRIAPEAQRLDPARSPVTMNICHPASAIHLLMGDVDSLWFDRAPNSAGVISLRFTSGAVGVLHFPNGKPETAPRERLEVTGSSAHVVIDNVIRLTYYRPGSRGTTGQGYGRTPSFYGADAGAPLHWEPEFDLGQLYSMTLFLQGYVPELYHFVQCAHEGRQPDHAGLRDALHLTHLYEAFRVPDRTVVTLPRLAPDGTRVDATAS